MFIYIYIYIICIYIYIYNYIVNSNNTIILESALYVNHMANSNTTLQTYRQLYIVNIHMRHICIFIIQSCFIFEYNVEIQVRNMLQALVFYMLKYNFKKLVN